MKWVHRAVRALPAAALGLLACGDGGVSGPDGAPSVALSVAGQGSGAAASLGAPLHLDVVQNDGANTLVLTRVAIVLREVELERAGDECDSSGSGNSCRDFEVGPVLVELPLNGSVKQLFVAQNVPPGVYDEVEFEIHKPRGGGGAADEQFILAHPDFRDVSIRVEGTFNGEGFVFLQDLDEEQEVELVPPLVVEAGSGSVNLTLVLDVTTWFAGAGGALIDPRTANKGGPNHDLVEENIKASIDVFDDDDRDGRR